MHMCIYSICMYCLTVYSSMRILLVSNCAIQIRFIIVVNIKMSVITVQEGEVAVPRPPRLKHSLARLPFLLL